MLRLQTTEKRQYTQKKKKIGHIKVFGYTKILQLVVMYLAGCIPTKIFLVNFFKFVKFQSIQSIMKFVSCIIASGGFMHEQAGRSPGSPTLFHALLGPPLLSLRATWPPKILLCTKISCNLVWFSDLHLLCFTCSLIFASLIVGVLKLFSHVPLNQFFFVRIDPS